jgi:hypothetical protein
MKTKSQMSDLTRRIQKVIVPLSKTEERQVIKAVVRYMTEQNQSGIQPHFRVLTVGIIIDKPPMRDSLPQRTIRVLVADYGNKHNMDFVLDSAGKIIKVGEYPGLHPPFHDEEIKEARSIARKDDRVAHLEKMRGLFVNEFVPGIVSETNSRLVGLHYVLAKKNIGLKLLARVIVDLSENRIISVEEEEEEMNLKEGK